MRAHKDQLNRMAGAGNDSDGGGGDDDDNWQRASYPAYMYIFTSPPSAFGSSRIIGWEMCKGGSPPRHSWKARITRAESSDLKIKRPDRYRETSGKLNGFAMLVDGNGNANDDDPVVRLSE